MKILKLNSKYLSLNLKYITKFTFISINFYFKFFSNISDNNLEQSSTEANNSSNEGVEKYVVSSPKNNKRKVKAPILPHHISNSKKKVRFQRKKHNTYHSSWKDQYPWILYDVNKNRMFCTLCMAHGQKNEFAKATKGIFNSNCIYFLTIY